MKLRHTDQQKIEQLAGRLVSAKVAELAMEMRQGHTEASWLVGQASLSDGTVLELRLTASIVNAGWKDFKVHG